MNGSQQSVPIALPLPGQILSQTTAGDGWFKTTHWTMVLNASRRDSPQASAALANLCQTYWSPVYSFVRRSGHGPEDAKDLTQEFFFRLLEKEYLKALDREGGKFRSFLLVVLKRFLANEWDRANRQKRGGGRQIVSIDEWNTELRYLNEPADNRTPETVFERRWALAVLEQVMNRLQAESSGAGKAELFGGLKDFLGGDGGGASYSEVATRLQTNEGALRVAVHRLRRRYREILREEIAGTVASPGEIDDEIRHLFLCLG
jgi:RNA polymerase sigma factor (sigma-70 family)